MILMIIISENFVIYEDSVGFVQDQLKIKLIFFYCKAYSGWFLKGGMIC